MTSSDPSSPLLAVVGPTASGKSEIGYRWADERNAEIISVDSRQVYQHLSIGTAAPQGVWTSVAGSTVYDVDGILTHLVDILDPTDVFSVAGFVPRALAAIEAIRSRGREPIFVGGTGLYFKALTDGLATLPPADPALRDALRRMADDRGRPALHRELQQIDPEAAKAIPANNIARVIRAIEVFRLTGKPISAWHREHQDSPKSGLRLRYVGVQRSLEEGEARIAARCRFMLDNGMIEETRNLLDKKYAEDCPGLTGLGYPRVAAFLRGETTRDELLTLFIRDTRRYAKRQRTWFRHQMDVEWLAPNDIQKFLKNRIPY